MGRRSAGQSHGGGWEMIGADPAPITLAILVLLAVLMAPTL